MHATKRVLAIVMVLAGVASSAAGSGFSFSSSFTEADFARLADAVADTIVFPNAGPAEPLGLTGFDLLAVGGGRNVDTGSGWWHRGVDGSTVAGSLNGGRLVARKGLPLGIDVGAQAGRVLGEEFWGGELKWALLSGGVVSPSVGLRVTYSKLRNAPVGLQVADAQLVVSKGFALVTPYAAAGYRRLKADATFGDPAVRRHEVTDGRAEGVVGVRLALTVIKVVAEVRQASDRSVFVGVGFGL